MKKNHLLRSILIIALCILMVGGAVAVGYTVYENAQGKKVVIDKDNNLPIIKPLSGSASAGVTTENGFTTSEVTLKTDDESIVAVIPEGTKLNVGVSKISLTVKQLENSQANVELEANEEKSSFDVHISGVSADNTTPIKVYVKEMLAKGLNIGNYKLYHVENGATVEMAPLKDGNIAHNSFEYDAETGDVTLYLASFSEVAAVANTENAWNGTVADNFASGNGTESNPYIIANADQLAYLSQAVSRQNDVYGSAYYKLIADVNFGGEASEHVFYPIGYWAEGDGLNSAGEVWYTYGGAFKGVFDGNGNTVSGIYQNTWIMDGNYDNGYWDEAMGLFGYVYGGTVKNLTVDSFSSDGEFTPTGTVAAYACNATFENIAVTNSNPRVYNTGNGGVVGVGGNSSDGSDKKLTFTNVTVDQTNKISALWGSWDVACGGIMGMFRGNGLVDFTNCHIAAQIDVNNDVCANYQYYWYRYAGMFIGSIRKNAIDAYGYTIPDTTGISATNCTYELGDWNEYWYCELVANSIASYTHDYQFSRLTKIASVSEIQDANGNWNTVGNFVIPTSNNESATCYHIMKDSEGNLYRHLHDVADESNPNIYEDFDLNGDGELNDLKEDRFCYFLPFNQLMTGDGWGVKAVYEFPSIVDSATDTVKSQVKFESTGLTEPKPDVEYSLSDFFTSTGIEISSPTVQVYLSPIDGSDISLVFEQDINDWQNGKIKFIGAGSAKLTITDYFYCTKTTVTVTLAETQPIDKFAANDVTNQNAYTQITLGELFEAINGATIGNVTATVVDPYGHKTTITGTSSDWATKTINLSKDGTWTVVINDDDEYCVAVENSFTVNKADIFINKFNKNFRYRVGNAENSPVALGSIFGEKDTDLGLSSVNVTITNVSGNASGVFTPNNTWTNGTIQFSGTGVVTLTISADGANDCSLNLEVIDAVNATGAASATSNNVVLLNDCGFSSITVSNGYTLYGNGFTVTCGSDSAALDTGYSFVTLDNGTLDNVQIDCPDFDYAVLYKTNMTSSENRSETTDRTRYYNVKSGVMVSGNSQILNSRVSGARAAVNVTGGNVLIDNSRIEGGAVATILVGSANSLTLRDVTLIQKPTVSTHDKNKTLMGFSVLFVCDSNGNAAPCTIEGQLIQDAWVNEDDKQYVPSDGQSIISTVLNKTNYLHDIDGDGIKESLNLGFAYLPESSGYTGVAYPTNIEDIRSNKDTVVYEMTEITIVLSTSVYIYSYTNEKGTDASFNSTEDYVPNKYSDIILVDYSDKKDGLEIGKTYGTSGWVYELNVDLDKLSGYAIDFSKLSISVNGNSVSDFKVNGSAKPTSPVAVVAGGVTYTLTTTIDSKEYTANFKVIGTETSKDSPSLAGAASYSSALGIAKSYGGDWTIAASVLDGITIRYWSVKESKYVDFVLSDIKLTGTGKLNGINNYWEYTHTDNDFTLKITNTVAIHSGQSIYGMPVGGSDGKLYFTLSSDAGFVGSGTTSRSLTMKYEFKDNNGGEPLIFSYTWNTAYNKDNQYKYSDLVDKGTLTKLENCISPDTLITLANGTQVRVDSLTGGEELLVWNLETGMLDKASIMFIDSDDEMEVNVVKLVFSDGTEVKVIGEHGFWSYNLNKYVYLDENASEYIGHYFAKQNGDTLKKVQLVDVIIEATVTTAWSPVTQGHLCYFVNGMLSMPGGVGGLFNIFEVDADTMTYNYDAMADDIERFGLFTYEELNAIAPLSREMFEQAGGAYLKISIAKGNLTMDELIYMINRYSEFFN